GRQVDSLNGAAAVIGRRAGRAREAVVRPPSEATVVTDITVAVRTEGGAIRTAADLRDHFHIAAREHARQATCGDLDTEYAAVGKRDGAFGKSEPGRDDPALKLERHFFSPGACAGRSILRSTTSITAG